METWNPSIKMADLINRFAIPRIQCQKSHAFFIWLKSLRPGTMMDQLKGVLKRPFIYKMSEKYPELIQTIGDIFDRQCPLLE